MNENEKDKLKRFLERYDEPAPRAPADELLRIISQVERPHWGRLNWKLWIPAAATATALAAGITVWIFSSAPSLGLPEEEQLAAFLTDSAEYFDESQDVIATDDLVSEPDSG